jgi:hypothetical protein
MRPPWRTPLAYRARDYVAEAAALVGISLEPVRSRVRANVLAGVTANAEHPHRVPVVFLLVYRARNAEFVQLLLRQIPPHADVRLWALDEIAPELEHVTLGSGPGARFVHLNSLYESRPVADGSWLVVADDDVVFVRGNLERTIELMRRAGFALAEPGQSPLGFWTHTYNIGRPLVVASDTNLVEIGPLFIADPAFSLEMLPFPADDGMGWGIEASWYRIKEGRYRIGIIDACRMIHVSRPGRAYATAPEIRRLDERLAEAGIESIWRLRTRNARWWRWQPGPPWNDEDTPRAVGAGPESLP